MEKSKVPSKFYGDFAECKVLQAHPRQAPEKSNTKQKAAGSIAILLKSATPATLPICLQLPARLPALHTPATFPRP